MRLKRLTKKQAIKIVAAASVAAFSLFAFAFGAFAWFSANLLSQISGDEYKVVQTGSGCGVSEVNLIKFEYPINPVTEQHDYTDGEGGKVVKYTLEDDVFVDEDGNTTDRLTTYDPAEKIIYGDDFSLFSTNCAALYEITIYADDYGDYKLNIDSLINPDAEKRTDRDLFLSDCADFCVFHTSDISTPIGINPETEKPYYYPSYIEYDDPTTDMSELENLYYRLSYQQSIKTSGELSHFYQGENEDKEATISLESNIDVTFSELSKAYTIYICINYAPGQLTESYRDIYESDITAVFDYYFKFDLLKVEE